MLFIAGSFGLLFFTSYYEQSYGEENDDNRYNNEHNLTMQLLQSLKHDLKYQKSNIYTFWMEKEIEDWTVNAIVDTRALGELSPSSDPSSYKPNCMNQLEKLRQFVDHVFLRMKSFHIQNVFAEFMGRIDVLVLNTNLKKVNRFAPGYRSPAEISSPRV